MVRRIGLGLLAAALALALVAEAERAYAQRLGRSGRGFGPPGRGRDRGITGLLRRESVQQELKITDQQREKLDQLQGELRQEMFGMFDLFRRLRSAETDQEREAARAELEKARDQLRKKAEEALQKILTPEQFQRLKQLELQQRGVRALAEDEHAQALGLSPQQREKIKQLLEQQEEKQRELFESLRDVPRDQRRERFEQLRQQGEQLRQQTEAAVLQVLSEEQRKQWQQMLGPPLPEPDGDGSRRAPRVVGTRPVSPPQSSDRGQSQPTPPRSSGPGKVILPSGAAGGGEPVASFGTPGTAGSAGQNAPGRQPPGQTPAADQDAAGQGTAAGQSTAAGQGTAASQSPAAGQASGPDGAPQGGQPVRYVSFNFRNAPWSEVLRLLADVTGLTLDLRDEPPGTFSYFDRHRYTPQQAIDVLNGYLLQRGYVLVRRDNFLVVLNVENGIPPNLVPTVPLSELPKRGRNELVSVIFPLGELDPEKTAEEIQGLLGPQGKVVPLRSSGSLVVTDIASNLLRVQALIQGASPQAGPEDRVFRAFALRYRPAHEAAELLRRLFNLDPGVRNVSAGAAESSGRSFSSRSEFFRRMFFGSRSRGGDDSSSSSRKRRTDISVAVDEWTNSVLVTAPAKEMKVVEHAVRTIDVPNDQQGTTVLGNVGRASGKPFLRVYQLRNADPREVAKTLGVLHPNNVINEDGRYRRLHIWATEEEHRQIAEHIRMLDGATGSSVAVIPLGGINPMTATGLIQSLFASDGQNAPVAVPDPMGRGLIVRGDPQQIAQVRMVLERYRQAPGTAPLQRGPVRQYQLGEDAARVARLLQRLWSATGANPIRVVVPGEEQSPGPRSSTRPGPSGRLRPSALQVPAPTNPPEEKPSQPAKRGIDDRTVLAQPRVPAITVSTTETAQQSSPNENPAPQQAEPAAPSPAGEEPDPVEEVLRWLAGEEDQGAEPNHTRPQNDRSEANRPPEPQPTEDKPEAKPPIVITVADGKLIISSQDTEALDRLERLLQQLAPPPAAKVRWTVFYLKNSDATEVAAVLEQMLPVGSGSGTNGPGTGSLQIVPESRSNALFVTGPPELVRDVEQLLKLLDADELPGQFRDRVPRTIPVRYADVNQVAEVLREVYRDYLEQPSPQESSRRSFFFRSFGSTSSRSSRSGSNRRVRMTLGVDEQTSQIVVSCSEALFRQVRSLVEELDEAARAAQRSVRVVALNNADTAAVQQALVSLFPQVTVSTTATAGSPSRTTQPSQTTAARPGSFDAERAERIRRFFEFLRARRMGMGSSSGRSPLGSPRGTAPGDRGSGFRRFPGPPGGFRPPGR